MNLKLRKKNARVVVGMSDKYNGKLKYQLFLSKGWTVDGDNPPEVFDALKEKGIDDPTIRLKDRINEYKNPSTTKGYKTVKDAIDFLDGLEGDKLTNAIEGETRKGVLKHFDKITKVETPDPVDECDGEE